MICTINSFVQLIEKSLHNINLQAKIYRSSWTDIPSDKINKISQKSTVDAKKLYEMKEQHKRDKLQDKIIKEHKKQHKRDKSLLEIHQKTKKVVIWKIYL